MKTHRLHPLLLGLITTAAALAPHPGPAAGPAVVNLGSTAHFTILAGAAITTTGGGLIHGDVGASPISGSAVGVTDAQVDGIIYCVDNSGPSGSVNDPTLLTTAKGDLTTAYNEARDRTPVPVGDFLNPGAGNIGGMNLAPGLYKFTGTAFITGSDLTLTGGPDDVWIFQIAADLQVGSAIQVILAGGAQARNIFWQVGTSAIIETFAKFKGTILADQAIVMKTSSTMEGRALAFTAGVTYNGDSGSLPVAAAPIITDIQLGLASNSVAVITTPYRMVTLQSSPRLVAPLWTDIASNTPSTAVWVFETAADVTQRMYRAFVTSY